MCKNEKYACIQKIFLSPVVSEAGHGDQLGQHVVLWMVGNDMQTPHRVTHTRSV